MYEIKKVNILIATKTFAISMIAIAIFSIILVLFTWFILDLLTGEFNHGRQDYGIFSFIFDLHEIIFTGNISSVILYPVVLGVIGFIVGSIGALVYNLIASWIGGIKMEIVLSEKEESEDQGRSTPQG